MSFPVNIPILCTVVLSPVNGVVPSDVTLTLVDPSSVPHSVPIALASTNQAGTYKYSGYFVPTQTGNWVRTWAGGNILTTNVATLPVA
ncbi:MAG TPA: hypothetical protein VN894_12350 [Polyangiaceae bacterium]|jgi:hypothetical protein|nr:hypothetical protein [Polyangiaceae bacterium]